MDNPLAAGRRALALIEAISSNPQSTTFSELAVRLGLSPASLTRLLKMLLDEGWVRQERPNGRYVVGYRALTLAHSLRSFGLHSPITQGVVTSLAHVSGHSACVATFQGDFFMLVAKFEMLNSYHFIEVFVPNTDWIDNGMGQALLAFQPREVVEDIYHRALGEQVPEDHWQRFAHIRKAGTYVSHEGSVMRVMAAINPGNDAPATSLMAVAAIHPNSVDVDDTLNKVLKAATEVTRRMSESRKTSVVEPALV